MRPRKKRILIFIFLLFLLLLATGVFLYMKQQGNSPSTEYKESDREDTVDYGGKRYQYNDHLSNFLFLGIDTTESVEDYDAHKDAGQADTIFLLSLNRVTNTLKCLSIPRDTMTTVRVISPNGTDLGTTENHINVQYAFGDGKEESCRLMKEAVSNLLYGIPIQGYMSLNMDGIPIAAETLGGVELVVPDDTLEEVNPQFKAGATVVITKENAEQFLRYRDTEESLSAIGRMNRQKVFMEAFAEKAKEVFSKDNAFIVKMYDSLEDYMVTNIGNDVFAKILEASYENGQGVRDIPGEAVAGEEYDEYHVNDDALYELILEMFYEEVQDGK